MTELVDSKPSPRRIVLLDQLLIFISLAALFGLIFLFFHLFDDFELETVNHRFEARRFLKWYAGGLNRLDLKKLLSFHESHESEEGWWHWQRTLDWLAEENHPNAALKIMIFNRLLEDEPPLNEVKNNAWMEPLLNYPLSRETLADLVSYLSKSGVKAICLNYDFSQFSSGDAALALAIHNASSGKNGHRTPVVLSSTIRATTSGNIEQLGRSGVIIELQKLEPGENVISKYTGISGAFPDEDQGIRRVAMNVRVKGKTYEATVIKLFRQNHAGDGSRGNLQTQSVPDVIDVDYISRPNASVFPVRPVSYLLNPNLKNQIASPFSHELSISGSIVILGDGIVDLYNTPLANPRTAKRSGSEILAQALDTLERRSWIKRLSLPGAYLYALLMALIAGLNFVLSRHLFNQFIDKTRPTQFTGNAASRAPSEISGAYPCFSRRSVILNCDVLVFLISLLSIYSCAYLLFAFAGLIVPVVVPAVSMTLAMLLTVLWERDRIKILSMEEKLQSWQERLILSQEKLVLAQEKHEAELAFQSSLTEQWAMEEDRRRRQDMIRRLNHDLKAPISVFNWTLAKLVKDRAPDDPALPVFERLKKSSDLLSNLLSEIVKSLSGEEDWLVEEDPQTCEITSCLKKQAELEMTFAEIAGSKVTLDIPPAVEKVWVVGSEIEIARIVDNVTGNALKHNPAGTRVTIKMHSYQWLDEEIRITIEDNGKGICKDDLGKIFQPGFRSDGSRIEGEGLGLSIASSLAKKIGAYITVESVPGEGTTFSIFLKRYRSERERSGSYLIFSENRYTKQQELALTIVESKPYDD